MTGMPFWDAPWVLPAAVAVLAAVVLAITGYLILASGHGEDQADAADARQALAEPGEIPWKQVRAEAERFATDTDVRSIGPVMSAGAASHYPGLYAHPPQVPRIVPDVPEQCWCGQGRRGHLPAYVSEVLSG
jgi:hypothetical protein